MFKIKLISGIANVKPGFLADKKVEGKTIFLLEDKFDETRKLNVVAVQETEATDKVKELETLFAGAKFELVEVKAAEASN